MNCSFQPDGKWFVFNDNGETLAKDLDSKKSARFWILKQLGWVKS